MSARCERGSIARLASPRANGRAAAAASWWKLMFDATSPSDFIDDLSPLGSPDGRARKRCDKDLQRAKGYGRMLLSSSEQGTRIIDVFQRSPIRIMFPRDIRGAVEEAVLVNTAGGIAGGDRLEIAVTALANASIAVTSQAAERVYRALNEP